MEKLAALATFLALPGRVLEGDHIEIATTGRRRRIPVERRRIRVVGLQSSDGMGLLEFLGWCEDLNVASASSVRGLSVKRRAH